MTPKRTSNILEKSLKELSIQVSLSGLSFCVLDKASGKIEQLEKRLFNQPAHAESLVGELDTAMAELSLSKTAFSEVRVIHDNELSTLVPRSLFNENNLSDYLKFNVKILANDFIGYDELTGHDIFNVYVPYTNVNNHIFDMFGTFEYKHTTSVLVETLMNKYHKTQSPKVIVLVAPTCFDIVVISSKGLVLHNRYPYQTREDFTYYLLYTYEQLKLHPGEVPLTLYGDIQQNSGLYKMAYTYIRNVNFGEALSPYAYTAPLSKTYAPHSDLILLNSF